MRDPQEEKEAEFEPWSIGRELDTDLKILLIPDKMLSNLELAR